jgi:hypothetical protein
LRDRLKEFETRDAQVIGVLPEVVDELFPSVKLNNGKAAFPVVSDLAGTCTGPYGQGAGSSSEPATILVDRDGVLRWAHRAGRDRSKRPIADRPTLDRKLHAVDGMKRNRALADELARGSDARLSAAVTAALKPGGEDRGRHLPVLITAVRSDDVAIRLGALAALWHLVPQAPEAIASLQLALKDRDARARRLAADTLGQLGPQAKRALAALVEALRDPDADVRAAVVDALWVVGPDAEGIVKALAASLKPGDAEAARAAAFALGRITPNATAACQALLGMLKHENPRARTLSAETLGRFDKPAQDVIQALNGALKDPELEVRKAATRSLKKLGSKPAKE